VNRLLAVLAAVFALAAPPTLAAWPEKTVTVVVPFPAGGSSDQIARALTVQLQKQFGQPFVVENKPGATGSIGATQVKRAAPDGYTLLVTSLGPFVIVPHLMTVPYDPGKDFDLLTVAVQAPNVLVVPASSPYKTVADVLAQLKKEPGKVSFATSGSGSSDHLTSELFWQQTGTKGLHVPYKGGAPLVTDLLGGQVDASFTNINAVITHVQSGKLRALAVTGSQRSPLLPQVPTLAESGVKGADVYSWQAVAGPKGLPEDVRTKLHAAIIAALNDPQVKANLTALGFEIVGNTPEQFVRYQAEEWARWKKVIDDGKITAQ
jgi:tripartite-type tricarboxylate transporter receptor subunit TctC